MGSVTGVEELTATQLEQQAFVRMRIERIKFKNFER